MSLKDINIDNFNVLHKTFNLNDRLCDNNFIGDLSRVYSLPLVNSSNTYRYISDETMHDLLTKKSKYNDIIYTIIDCRYPYEYNNGHIQNAENLYTISQIKQFKDINCKIEKENNKKHILIFYCEFSSKRAPKLLKALRKYDRDTHINEYPQLDFPEIYIIQGGYNKFYTSYKYLCVPQSYCSMFDKNYKTELKKYKNIKKNISLQTNKKKIKKFNLNVE